MPRDNQLPDVCRRLGDYGSRLRDSPQEGQELSKSSVKQHLAALRMLFDWLVVGHALDSNPAHAVRGPKYSQKER